MTITRTCLASLLLASLLLVAPARAQDNLELGKMWTFDHIPLDYFEHEHGFRPTQEWLDAVRLSALRFGGGCSASFVSPKGLIMTNHHCARGDIEKACPPGEDWIRDGYVARKMADEVKLEGLAVKQLVASRDVTAEMNAGIEDGDDDAVVVAKRRDNERKIIADAQAATPGNEAQVTPLYQGGIYMLYQYRVFTDLRLVASPHLQTAHFGGDPDNFTYPRWGIDYTFVRAYENDQPFDSSKHYFKFKSEGAQEHESIFIPGNPGSTNRLMTLAELEYTRDVYAPIIREHIEMLLAYLEARIEADPSTKQALLPQVLRFENGRKAWAGYHGALLDDDFMAQKAAAEEAFRARVLENDELAARYGSAWEQIADICSQMAGEMAANRVHRDLENPLLARAAALITLKDPEAPARAKEAAKRLVGEGDLEGLGAPEMLRATMWLEHARRWAEDGNAFVAALSPELPAVEAVTKLWETSALKTGAGLAEMLAADPDQVLASTDPALVAARALLEGQRAHMSLLQKLQVRLEAQKTRIGEALFAVYGTSVSPDATGTLRLSDGKVEGYPMNGTLAPWKTTFYSLYGRCAEFGNTYPFDLPAPWLKKRALIDMEKPVDFCSTNDIIGGNSGSVVINKDLEAVGLVFDGNIEMLGNNYMYRDDIPRSVSVHVGAILEALEKIYEVPRVVDELLGR
ncbi:MAG: S46 family peptidase [Planctomycetes bacterium]|nr:S46 family peptidase [Planctomycetota bacterium]